MFKIIKTELFDEFRCLMGACKDNCCDENWIITIDDDTYELYKSMGIDELDEKITVNKPHTLIKKNGKCPFITAEGLCILHRDFGEKYISNTCRSYPRFVSTYGDLYIENIGLSCPASAKWITELDRKVSLKEETYYEDQSEVGKSLQPSDAEIFMKAVIGSFYKSDSFEQSVRDIESSRGLSILNDELTAVCTSEFVKENELMVQNVGISYLFEHIMLESTKADSDYSKVVIKLINIIGEIAEKYNEFKHQNENIHENLADAIYKTMRRADHGI